MNEFLEEARISNGQTGKSARNRLPHAGFRAKTNILVPQLKLYYVAAPRHENEIAGVKVFEIQ
jgi:hypothetical protein